LVNNIGHKYAGTVSRSPAAAWFALFGEQLLNYDIQQTKKIHSSTLKQKVHELWRRANRTSAKRSKSFWAGLSFS